MFGSLDNEYLFLDRLLMKLVSTSVRRQKFFWFQWTSGLDRGWWVIHDGMAHNPIQGHRGLKVAEMATDIYVFKRLMVNCDTPRWYLNFSGQIFLLFILVWHHMTFRLRLFYLLQTNFASYDEAVPSIWGLFFTCRYTVRFLIKGDYFMLYIICGHWITVLCNCVLPLMLLPHYVALLNFGCTVPTTWVESWDRSRNLPSGHIG